MKEITIDVDSLFLISDIHFGVRSDASEWIKNMHDYFFNFFIPLIDREKTLKSGVFVLGDVFDNRETLNIEVVNIAIKVFSVLSKHVPVYCIVGNHDMYKKVDNEINSLRILKSLPNIHIIEENTLCKIKDIDTTILAMPYTTNNEKASNILNSTNVKYAFLHSDLVGFRYDNGRNILSGINTSTFSGYKIFSGHIHKRQESDTVIYIGSPYHTKRSDIGNTKGIYKIDLVNDTEQFFVNNYSPIFQKWDILKLLDKPFKDIKTIFRNNYTDIIINKKYVSSINVAEIMNVLRETGYKKVEFITVENEDGDYDNNQVLDTMDTLTIDEAIEKRLVDMSLTKERSKEIFKLTGYYKELVNNQIEKIDN